MSRHVPSEIRRHWGEVRKLGCIVTGDEFNVTLHHCHSGSMAAIGFNRGSTRSHHWLVIPLRLDLHSLGPEAIDGAKGVESWEAQYGSQVSLPDKVCARTGVDVWARSRIVREAA